MTLKTTPNRQAYIEVLRRMTPSQRLQKAWELTQATREMLLVGLKRRYPEASDAEIHKHYLERLGRCHNRNY